MNQYIELARLTIEEYIKYRKIIDIPENLPPEFYDKKCGVFVSIRNGKELRGCIGTYLPVHKNLAEEIILNAIAACSKDSRFSPITAEEFPALFIEISLLSEPEKISRLKELDPKKFGVIVKSPDERCGLLLPDLEGIDSAEQQFSITCQKAGINPSSDKKFDLYRFSVEKYSS